MQYEFRGRTLQEALRKSFSGTSCKTDTRAECERISRVRANHYNNIETALEDIEETIEEINSRAEALGDDARDALIATGLDVASLVFAGASALRAIRAAKIGIDAVIAGGGATTAVLQTLNVVSDYKSRIEAFREWFEISRLRAKLEAGHMDLERSIRVISEANDEWERLGCGRRDHNDPRGPHQLP